jgi:hypothetical protein
MPCPSPARLRQELAQALPVLDDRTPQPGQRWYWLTNRLWAKALAVGAAVALWMAVAGQRSAEIALTVPVEYQRIAPTVELRGDVPTEVLIRLRGPQLALDALRASPARVRVSLEQARDGLNYVVMTARHIDLPPGVELTDIRPSLLVLEVRKKSDVAPSVER